MAELLAKAREKKKQEKIDNMVQKVAEESKTVEERYPNAPRLPEHLKKKEEPVKAPISLKSSSLQDKLERLRKQREEKEDEKHRQETNSISTSRSLNSPIHTGRQDNETTKEQPNPVYTDTGDREPTKTENASSPAAILQPLDKYGNPITYNKEQQEFVDLVAQGKSCVLIGAAGTGKTTCTQGGLQALISSGKVPVLQNDGHKHLPPVGAPGVVIIAYTRRAVNNIKRVLPKDLKGNCITAHKLLEYEPVYYEVDDPKTGETKKTMRFEPSRNEVNPLPSSIHTVVVEEGSMLGLDLYAELAAALPHEVQWIFLGDIQQLPPVFGPAILGFKMLELPVIELTQVYRQALESPIIRLAHRILSGKPIPAKEFEEWKTPDQLTLHPWKKKLSAELATMTLAAFFTKAVDTGVYNIDEDIILIPYNKSCGTLELNKHIANHIARKNGEVTYEVMAGFNKHYFSVGDKVLYDKEDAEIVEITYNSSYTGARVQPESRTLDYWGHNPNIANETRSNDYGIDDVDFLLSQVESAEDRVTQSSHSIVVKLLDTGATLTLSKAAEVNALLHSYALTVHKAQGSEWRKVFLALHQSHATMLQRELLYTAVTRAKEELYVICEPESFTKGINSQRVKGNTLAEKAEYFKGKIANNEELLG